MELYKRRKVNPVAGCLPMLLQIPVFFALYKVLYLAIEMRHRDFLWIKDLSAPDPANLANALAYSACVPQFLMIIFGLGVLAVLLGFTMWLTFRLNPSQMDPMQQKIFDIMPWILMFVMAPFAAGLLLYWVTSNVLTLAQQKYLYSKHPQLRASIEDKKKRRAKAPKLQRRDHGRRSRRAGRARTARGASCSRAAWISSSRRRSSSSCPNPPCPRSPSAAGRTWARARCSTRLPGARRSRAPR